MIQKGFHLYAMQQIQKGKSLLRCPGKFLLKKCLNENWLQIFIGISIIHTSGKW